MSEPKRIAGRFEVHDLIGRGAMGAVYRGRDCQSGLPVAIKVLHPYLANQQPELVERFRRESEVLRKLNHPNIVKVLDAFEAGEQYYLVMEYVGGGTLADLLKRQPQLPIERALPIALELADALTRTHHLNIVHRDIKPANILLAEDGTPRLTDFGLALAPDEQRLTQPGMTVGTWLYLSPEVCSGTTPDARSDVWSFGVVLYEMLAGRPPFAGDSLTSIVREITSGPFIALSDLRDDIAADLDQLVRRMLMKDTAARIASFRQIGAALEAIAAGRPAPGLTPSSTAQEHATDPLASQPMPSVQIEVQWSDETPVVTAPPQPGAPSAMGEHDSTPRLLTKLAIPPARPQLVARARLLQLLNDGLRHGHRLTLISAPAGFGKTTLAGTWLASSQGHNARPLAWLTLDAGDNDPAQFFQYLVAALQQVAARAGTTTLQLLQSPQFPSVAALMTPLINDLAAAPALTLVIDDCHVVTSALIHEAVGFLIEHLPQALHLVIITREDPPLSLARLRARDLVTEVRERDLRFTPEETAAFLNDSMRLGLSPSAVEQLAARTEGWAAGLQLAALALRENPADAETFVAGFTGDHRYVMDYLLSEVLERQPPDVRTFLRQTSILDRLSASLCDWVIGEGERGSQGAISPSPPHPITPSQPAQAMLEQLEHANLFVIPLDGKRTWFRYHQLFAEVLRKTLSMGEKAVLHRRAAQWYEARGAGADAITHALAAAGCGAGYGEGHGSAYQDAARLICGYAETYINDGRLATVLGWLASLPDADVRATPDLAIYQAWGFCMAGDLLRAAEYVDAAETAVAKAAVAKAAMAEVALHAAPYAASRGKLCLVQSFLDLARGDFEGATHHARETLAQLAPTHPWRITALWALAEAQERSAPITDAIASLYEAAAAGHARGRTVFAAVLDASLASALNTHGQRRAALAVCQHAIDRYSDEHGHAMPVAALLLNRLALLHYEANQLTQATACQQQAQTLAEQLALEVVLAVSDGMAATLHAARGETDAALERVRQALQHVARESVSDVTWIGAIEGNIHLNRGDIESAQRWAGAAGLSPSEPPNYLRIEQHCVYARLLLAQGHLDEAQQWLARLDQFVTARGYKRWLITVRLLQAVAADQAHDIERVRACLAEAVGLSAAEDYRRPFLDEDPQLLAHLPRVRHHAPEFVDALLEDAQHAAQPAGTVKQQLGRFYGKLDFHKRAQAVARALRRRGGDG